MILRLTLKAQKKIKMTKINSDQVYSEYKPLKEWYVNHFILERKGYFIVTESKSLFSMIVPSVGISSRKIFEEMIKQLFEKFENEYCINDDKLSADSIEICKTNNRSILGSQNELVRMAEVIYYHDDVTHRDLSRINETPMLSINSFPNIEIRNEVNKRKNF